MAYLDINLLPLEFRQQQIKKAKFYKIQAAGVAIILALAFLSSLTIALRILQSQTISKVRSQITQSEQKISEYKTAQGSLLLLKDRLTAINQYWGIPSRQAQMYKLLSDLVPTAVAVNSITVSKDGDVLLLAVARDSEALDNFITNLTSQEKNGDKISQVSMENLNRGRDGVYRLSFKIKAKN